MRKSDESMKWPFAREDMADNLIEWAGKMKALGEVWGALSWHVDRYDGDTDALARCGETLGTIIGDYAGMIEDTVTEEISSFFDYIRDKNVVFPLADVQKACALLREGGFFLQTTLDSINCQLSTIEAFEQKAIVPILTLKEELEMMKKKFHPPRKSAPTAESAAAGA
jgi:hypothetical protein